MLYELCVSVCGGVLRVSVCASVCVGVELIAGDTFQVLPEWLMLITR